MEAAAGSSGSVTTPSAAPPSSEPVVVPFPAVRADGSFVQVDLAVCVGDAAPCASYDSRAAAVALFLGLLHRAALTRSEGSAGGAVGQWLSCSGSAVVTIVRIVWLSPLCVPSESPGLSVAIDNRPTDAERVRDSLPERVCGWLSWETHHPPRLAGCGSPLRAIPTGQASAVPVHQHSGAARGNAAVLRRCTAATRVSKLRRDHGAAAAGDCGRWCRLPLRRTAAAPTTGCAVYVEAVA